MKAEEGISKKAGLPPGSLIHIGDKKESKVNITVFDYNKEKVREEEHDHITDLSKYNDSETVTWLNIDGLHNIDLISSIGEKFNLNHLLIEDILNTNHRPKAEEFEELDFVTLKMLGLNKGKTKIVGEQISFILGEGWVISFQERKGDVFDGLRGRIRSTAGMVRSKGADYLLYRLIDTVVDNYYFIVEHFEDTIERLERTVASSPSADVTRKIQQTKRKLVNFKKSVLPLREVLNTLQRTENGLIAESTQIYLRDVSEHVVQIIESIDNQKEILSSIMDMYMSEVSNKMNQIMQTLTLIATIFIPLTFIAGIYGMNFDHMPELHWKYGYLFVWGVMIVIFVGMIYYFNKKKWL